METKTKHVVAVPGKTGSPPIMKLCLIGFSVWALTAYQSHAGVINLPSHSASEDFRTTQLRLRVWFEKGGHKLNLDSKGVILKGYDPVAYFTQKRAVKGNPKYLSTYQGAIYYFSSAADLSVFKKDPAKYVPQYGGFCADGMRNRQANEINPTVFFILKGKLYLCTSPAAEKQFRSNEQENIRKADQNWYEEYRWFY
jgi:YHS domain-containing protein